MNKFTKLLSVFIIAGALGTGIAGATGCTKKGGDETGHKHNYTWVDDENGTTHHEHCSVDGCDTPDKAAENHTWSGDECDKCHAAKPADGVVAPAGATGIITEWEGGLEDITLSETLKTASIDTSKVKVYYAIGSTKGAQVPAANYVVTVNKDGSALTELTGLKQGHYEVLVELQNVKKPDGTAANWESFDEIDILNPVRTDSLAVKTGTLTQGQSVQNKMSADWTYTVTLANGDVIDYTETVTVEVDTETLGEQTATLTSGNLRGTVKVTITEAHIHTETYATNLSGKEIGALASQTPTADAVELFSSANGNTKLEARGVNIEANGNNAAKECDGKYFVNRAPFAGATFTTTNTLQTNQRYFILNTEGAAKLTIYWSRNSSTDERGVSVFNSTVTNGDISQLTPSAETVAKNTLSGATSTQAVQKFEVNIPAAGTYWITTANNQNVYFYYIELTTEFDGEGANVELADGDTTLAQVKVTHSTPDYKQAFAVGDTFNVDSGYSVTGTFITANTAKKSEQTLTELTYWLGNTQLIPGTTVLSGELFNALGDNTITVKYGEETVTGSYTIFVDSAVPGITGITATVKDTVNKEVESAEAKVTLAKTDIEAALVGENANAQLTITSVKYRLKSAEAGSETEITESVELGVGNYVIVVSATVTDTSTNNTADFEATVEFMITVAGASEILSADESTVANLTGNAVESEKIKIEGTGSGSNNKTACGQGAASSADGKYTFENAWLPGGGNRTVTITAKQDVTIKILYTICNSGFTGADAVSRAGELQWVITPVGGTAGATVTDSANSGNKSSNVVYVSASITLSAGDSVVLSASADRLVLFGVEAV
ncbi:MAG: hypothetical protein K2J54_01655 [Clostridia bacterium]|nr:hypothetical protein [Clostridia bacterium]